MTAGKKLITKERQRQIESEGWSIAHDDKYKSGVLGRAGSCYENSAETGNKKMPHNWPWSKKWWKPKDEMTDLIRAGALYLAEAEKQERKGNNLGADFWQKRADLVAKTLDVYINQNSIYKNLKV